MPRIWLISAAWVLSRSWAICLVSGLLPLAIVVWAMDWAATW